MPNRLRAGRALSHTHAGCAVFGIALLLGCTQAPEPSIVAERPDFTGVWGVYREPGQPRTPRGSRLSPVGDLPMKPEAQARVDAYHALVDPTGDTPGGYCLGAGMPGSMLGSGGYPMEIVQHEDLIVVIYEAHNEIRHIYLGDGAAEEDLFADRNGYSIGRWEGQKLIVETTHLKDALDQRQFPHGDQAAIVEQYELTTAEDGSKVLVANMTLTDPEFYTEPVEAEKKWAYLPGARLLPYECNEPTWEEHLEDLRSQGLGESTN